MSRRYVSQLGHNEQVAEVFMASDKQLRPNRNGNLYLQLELSDKSGGIATRMWNASDKDYSAFDNGDYVVVEGATQLFQGNMQMIANNIRRARPDEVDEADFRVLEGAQIDAMAVRLAEILRGMQNAQLAGLAEAYLSDEAFMAKFKRAPAGMKNHHAYHGGLLEHVVSLMELVLAIAPRYPQLSQDKLLVGAFLHDSAKVDELAYERDLSYTDEGQMLGHMTMAISELENKVKETERATGQPFDPILLMEIKHLIISHHGKYEYGSAKLPMTLEAVALHQLDNLDAQLASFTGLINDCPNLESNWTQYYPNLGRKLWKGAR